MRRALGLILAKLPKNYELIVIEEGKIPLAASVTDNYQIWIFVKVVLLFFLLLLAISILYTSACQRKRCRIAVLEKRYGQQGYRGWNLVRLGREIDRMELEAVTAEKNLKKVEPKTMVQKSY